MYAQGEESMEFRENFDATVPFRQKYVDSLEELIQSRQRLLKEQRIEKSKVISLVFILMKQLPIYKV